MKLEQKFDNLYVGEHNSEKLALNIDTEFREMNIRLAFFTPGGKSYVSDNITLSSGKADFPLSSRLLDCPGRLLAQILVYVGDTFVKKSKVYEYNVLPSADFHTGAVLTDDGLITLGSLADKIAALVIKGFCIIDGENLSSANGELRDACEKTDSGQCMILLKDKNGYHPVSRIENTENGAIVVFEYIHDNASINIAYNISFAEEDKDMLIEKEEGALYVPPAVFSLNKNSTVFTAQMLDIARSYYRHRGNDADGYNFTYGTHTCFDDGFDPNSDTAIDCSAYIGLVLRGIPFNKCPYSSVIRNAGLEADHTDISGDGEDGEQFLPDGDGTSSYINISANKSEYSWAVDPGEYSFKVNMNDPNSRKPVRTASQIAEWMHSSGREIGTDSLFTDVEPGDLIFYAKKNTSTGEWRSPDRFRRISHIALCAGKYKLNEYNTETVYEAGSYVYVKSETLTGTSLKEGMYNCTAQTYGSFDPSKWIYIGAYRYRHTTLEVTNTEKVVMNKTLEKTNTSAIVMIARPDLGALTNGEFVGNITSEKSITDIDKLYDDGFYYLTSEVVSGLPAFNRNTGLTANKGSGYVIEVKKTYRKNGQPYSVVQTLTDTLHNNEIATRAKYLYSPSGTYFRPDDPGAPWTDWSITVNGAMLNAFADGNSLGKPVLDGNGNWTVTGGLDCSKIGAIPEPDASVASHKVLMKVNNGTDDYIWDFDTPFYGYLRIHAGDDLNSESWWNIGRYYIDSAADAAQVTNCPVPSGGLLVVMYLDGLLTEYKLQIYFPRSAKCNIYIRYKNSSRIFDWQTFESTSSNNTVLSINGKTGNVTLTAADINALAADTPLFSGSYNDLSNKPTIPTVPSNVSAFNNDAGYLTEHQSLAGLATNADIANVMAVANGKTSTYIFDNGATLDSWLASSPTGLKSGDVFLLRTTDEPDYWYDATTHTKQPLETRKIDLTGYATLGYVNDELNGKVDTSALSAYALKTELPTVPTNVSAFNNDAGYLTSHQDLSSYAAKTELNGKANLSHIHSATDITSGTLPVDKGGTGQTSLNSTVANALINALSTGNDVPKSADYYVSQYANGGTGNTTYYRRPVSKLWDYMKTQGAVYGANNTSYQIEVSSSAPASGTANNIITLVV